MSMMQHQRLRYISLDVAPRDDRGGHSRRGRLSPSSYGTIANDPTADRKLMTRLVGTDVDLQVAYEAGLTVTHGWEPPVGMKMWGGVVGWRRGRAGSKWP